MALEKTVGIGGSAGAVAAVQALCAELPANVSAAFFVAVHTAPEGPGLLGDIINRRSAIPAALARDGEPIEAGREQKTGYSPKPQTRRG